VKKKAVTEETYASEIDRSWSQVKVHQVERDPRLQVSIDPIDRDLGFFPRHKAIKTVNFSHTLDPFTREREKREKKEELTCFPTLTILQNVISPSKSFLSSKGS
jgi:hypothetical protein